jgi:hypothetical protein
MLHFDARKCLGKCVGDHVVSRAINEINSPIINDKLNKMIPDINMFAAGVIRPVTSECDGSL